MDFILNNCVTPLVGLLRDYLLKHVQYIIRVGDNVEKLNRQAVDLEAKKKTVEDAIEAIERSTSQKRTKEVVYWLEKVENILRSSQEIQGAYQNKNCMLGTRCSFNCCSNYSIGKRAFNLQVEVGRAREQINHITSHTSEMVPPNVRRMNTTTESLPTSQLEFLRQEALSFIKEDTQDVLGIWGMGGVGKTTLLKHINNSLLEENKFQCIFVVASQGCTKRKLQELIADQLGLSKDGDHLSENIFNCLESKDFVLFVDDLWDPLGLNDVGIPYPLGVCNGFKRKVILTTRFQNVCGNMGTGSNIIDVQCLKWDEAWALFVKNVGQGIIDSANPRIRTLAKDVARECCGHPLTLITVGRAMSQNETVDMWEDALEKLRASRIYDIPDIQGMGEHGHTLSLLSVSYDYLKTDRLKGCFLLCALWPEDFSIEHDDLIQCWMGHGLLDGFDNISQVYREGKVVIDTLLKACLLEEGEKDHWLRTSICVKMHDLTRDMALWVARERGVNKKKWLVFTDIGDESEMVNITPEADKVSIFFNRIEIEGLTAMISRNWLHLTTLIIKGGGGSLGDEDFANLQYCSSLRYLDVSGNNNIQVIPVEIGILEKLEYLDLRGTSITLVPFEMKNLTNLKYLFLGDVRGIADGVLSNLTSLQVLDMDRNREDVSSVILDELEVTSGRQLIKALGITLCTPSSIQKLARHPTATLTSLVIKDMDECSTVPLLSDSFLGRPHMHSHLKSLEIMCCGSLKEVVMMQERRSSCRLMETQHLNLDGLEALREIVWRGVEPVDVFPKLREIEIRSCHELEHVSWAAHLPSLQRLTLGDCDRLSCIVALHEQAGGEAARPPTTVFPSLKSLMLSGMGSLISICDQETAFPSLEFLRVNGCEKLKKLPFLYFAASSSSSSSGGKLESIVGTKEWWENLELDPEVRTSLQPLLQLLYCYTSPSYRPVQPVHDCAGECQMM